MITNLSFRREFLRAALDINDSILGVTFIIGIYNNTVNPPSSSITQFDINNYTSGLMVEFTTSLQPWIEERVYYKNEAMVQVHPSTNMISNGVINGGTVSWAVVRPIGAGPFDKWYICSVDGAPGSNSPIITDKTTYNVGDDILISNFLIGMN